MNVSTLDMKTFAKELNNSTFTDYYYRLLMLSRTCFKWENLPNGIDEKWIERFLCIDGHCIFFKDEEKGFMVARCNPSGQVNPYDEYTHLTPYGTGYQGKSLENGEECILIRNNDEMIPTIYTLKLYAWKLAEISRTIDINVNAQKTPVVIRCSEKQKQTLKQVYAKWNGLEPIIFGDKNLDLGDFEVLKTDAPIVFDKLQKHKHEVWNEVMTFLGINNANMDKRERLVDDEVQANNEQIEMSSEVMLKARKWACKQINDKYDLNIKVSFRNENRAEIQSEGGIAE